MLPAGALLEEIRCFDRFGTSTSIVEDDDIPFYFNEFWTAGQRQAHAIHEVSYRACFKPQLPDFFITRLSAAGDGVHDPFMGRGTTPIQAALRARRPVGCDINPLSVMLTRPRLDPPTLDQVQARLSAIDWRVGSSPVTGLDAFFHPDTLRQILALRAWLSRGGDLDRVDDWIRMVAINRLTGHSPGFFSVYTLPPNQAVSVEAQRRINTRRAQAPPPRDVPALIMRKTRALLRDGPPPKSHPPALLSTGPAWDTPDIRSGSIALIVTSPPFLDVVQYADDNWLRGWFAGIDTDSVAIDMHRGPSAWQVMVRRCLVEFARIVRPGGHVAFEVGDIRGGRVRLERLVWAAAEGLPFDRLGVLVNQQEFTKTAHCWGVANNAKGTNSNRIVLLRRRD